MFRKKPNPEVEELNAEISRVLGVLARIEPDSDEYAAASDALATLYAQKEKIPSKRPSPDAVVTTVGSLAGILLIVIYEKHDVWTTRALDVGRKALK